jgi:hypothetical protein
MKPISLKILFARFEASNSTGNVIKLNNIMTPHAMQVSRSICLSIPVMIPRNGRKVTAMLAYPTEWVAAIRQFNGKYAV